MNKNKKIIAWMLVLTIILTNLTFRKVEAFHEALNSEEEIISEGEVDDDSLIDISSININKSEVVSGDTVKLSFKVNEDIDKLKEVYAVYSKPSGYHKLWMTMEYNSDTGYFEGYKSIGDYTEEGIWEIDEINLRYFDGTENNVENSINSGEDLSLGTFSVTGTESDIEPPVLDVESLTLSSKKAVAGDRLLLTVKASDDKSGISDLCIIYSEPEEKYLDLTYNEENDIYEGYIDIDENTTLGEWKISTIYLEDKEQNYKYIDNGISESENNVKDLSAGNFTVVEEIISEGEVDDDSLIDISSISVDKSEVVSGDTVKLSFKVNEDISKISGVTTIYNKGTTGAWKWMSMDYNSDTGCYEGYKSIGDYTEGGTWTIDQIHLEYIDGTEKYLQNINDIDYEEGEDFSGGNFIVIGTDSDLKPPVLDVDSLTLSTQKVVAGDRLLLTVKASDDKSGISDLCIIYREPEEKSLDLTYNEEKDVYEGYIDIDENTTLGEWKISQVYLEDKEENYIYINNGISETENNVKDLSAGNFTVVEEIISEGEVDDDSLIDISSININKNEVVSGDTVKLILKVNEDISNIREVHVMYNKPNEYWKVRMDMNYNSDTGYFEGYRTIGDYTEAGMWTIDRIYLGCIDGTEEYIKNINDKDYEEGKDLSCGDFNVIGTDSDIEAPELDISSLSISAQEAMAGDRLCISAKALDDKSGIDSIIAIYLEPEYRLVSLNYNEEKDIYEGFIDINEDTTIGKCDLHSIYLKDKEQNYKYVYNNPNGTSENDKDLSAGNFTVVEYYSLIDISSINVDKSEVVSGDTVKLSFKVNEDISKISGVTTIYNKGTTGAWKWMSMDYNSDTGCYEGYKSIGDYTEGGTWTIDQIHLEYIDGTEKYLQNINDIDYEEGGDFSGGNFIVTGTDSDLKPPVLDVDSLTLSTQKAVSGDRLLLTVKASDDKSGIDRISVIYTEPEYKSLGLTYNEEKDVYEGYIDIDENTALGEWKISQIYLEDKEENYIYINNGISETENNVKDLSAGNFTVLEYYENPIINGVEEVTLKVGDTFDPMDGVTAFDCEGRELTSDIIVTGNVTTWLVGNYSLTYTVTDIYGVTTTEIRIVRVTLGVTDLNGDGKIDIYEFLKWIFNIS